MGECKDCFHFIKNFFNPHIVNKDQTPHYPDPEKGRCNQKGFDENQKLPVVRTKDTCEHWRERD